MQTRHPNPNDHLPIHSALNDWWGGRNMQDMLSRLFFTHFQNTSFIIEENGEIVAFLIGFLSQTHENEAYIHFIGVHPDYRKHGLATDLYQRFFTTVQQMGRDTVRCVTSPVNKGSIAFHTRMGFKIEPSDQEIEGVPVHTNHDGLGQDRVLFVRHLQKSPFPLK